MSQQSYCPSHFREGPGARALRLMRFSLRILVTAMGLLQVIQGAEDTSTKEYEVKAAFLYNFTKYVEWRGHHFADEHSPIVIGVLGRNPFGAALDNTIRGRKVNSRELLVRLVNTKTDALKTDLLFVCVGEEKYFQTMTNGLALAGILTVGESAEFYSDGGIIGFTLEGDKLRFAVNVRAARQSGLQISAQLLKLAESVEK